MKSGRTVVIGGGVIGCAIARHLALAGADVLVLERDRPGSEASWAAAGMLTPLAEARQPGPFLDLLIASREQYPSFAAALREETGIDVGYQDAGTLALAFSEADQAELDERFAWQSAAGLDVEELSATAAHAIEPAISPELRAALLFRSDHQVENRLLARALASAAARAGAEFRLGAEVRGVLQTKGELAGVELASGERVEAATVVVAGGSWAGRLGGLPRPLPVHPVHGQLLALDRLPPVFTHVVESPRCYLVPRRDGRLIAGATMETIGFRKAVTPAAVIALLSGALEIAPELAQLPIVELWSGLRPATPDGLPILGRDAELPGLIYATGHFRNGILLAPITGELIGELILGRALSRDLSPFSIERFGTERG